MATEPRLGGKIRRLRQQRGLTQAQLAARLLISPSYLNLIEHNRRPLTVPLLFKLGDTLDVDLQSLSETEEAELLSRLEEVFADRMFEDAPPEPEELNELVALSPGIGQSVLRLYRAYRDARDDVLQLGERLSEDTFLDATSHRLRTLLTSIRSFSEILHDNADLAAEQRQQFLGIVVDESQTLARSVEELLSFLSGDGWHRDTDEQPPEDVVAAFIATRRNHFPELEDAAEAMVAAARDAGADLTDWLSGELRDREGVEVAPAPDAAVPAFDAEGQTLFLSPFLRRSDRLFLLARRLAHARYDNLLDECLAESTLAADAARALARRTLAKYVAGAILMPYATFHEAAETLRYDVDLLSDRFDVSFEQVCHRLTTLGRPGAQGVPFHLVRVDVAGNVSQRYAGSGIRMPRYGGLCPLWNVHSALTTPNRVNVQLGEMPDGSAYICVARAETRRPPGRNAPSLHTSVGIGADISHADQIVYADGLDLQDRRARVPLGTTCRICSREDCAHRVRPALVQSPM